MLNPIEFVFSKIKAGVKRRIVNEQDLDLIGLINESITDVTSEDLKSYFRLIRRNCTKAIAFEDFN